MKTQKAIPVLLISLILGLTILPMLWAIVPRTILRSQSELVRVAEYTMNEMDFSFGTWGKGIMQQGLLDAYNITGDPRYEQFVQFWTLQSIWTQTSDGLLGHGDVTLGDATALARPVVYFYQRTGDPIYLQAAMKHLNWLRTCDLRVHDIYGGISHTYNRLELWVDQMYMVNIFMTEMGVLLNDQQLLNESINQTKSHVSLLQDPATGLFRHIIREMAPGVYEWRDRNLWGRGIGWAIACIVDQMDFIESDPLQVDNLNYLNNTLNQIVINLTATQDSTTGLWHTLMYDTQSYLETSCSALFAYSLAKAVNKSWIGAGNVSTALKAFKGVLNRVNDIGILTWVSGGTGEHPELVPRFDTAISWGQGIFMKCYRFFANHGWSW